MKLNFAASVALTWTSIHGLANAASCQSAKVDNSTSDYLDALLSQTFKTAAGSLATTPTITVYAYGSLDGTTWADGITGLDAAWTPPTNITGVAIAIMQMDAANSAKTFRLCDIALAFGGTMPPYWTLAATNATGLALAATPNGGSASFVGVTTQ